MKILHPEIPRLIILAPAFALTDVERITQLEARAALIAEELVTLPAELAVSLGENGKVGTHRAPINLPEGNGKG